MTVDSETYTRIPSMPPPRESGGEDPRSPRPSRMPAHRRLLIAGPVVALVSLFAAVLTTDSAGLPLRDPDHVAGRRLAMLLGLVALLIVLDVLVRAGLRSRTGGHRARRSRASGASAGPSQRGVAVGTALVSFYVTYLAYRNLKSVVPLVRPGDLFDQQLADFDRSLFGGHDPAALLHELLGTGVQAHFMSGAYMMFFAFIPGTLAFALVFARNLQPGLFYVTAQSINWLLGRGELLPAALAGARLPRAGRVRRICRPRRSASCRTCCSNSGSSSFRTRRAARRRASRAFSSLHVSFFFTAALTAHLLGLPRPLRIAAWFLLALTIAATIYLGWHYVVDDIAGVAIGALAIVLARALTGLDLRTARRTVRAGARTRDDDGTRWRARGASVAGPAVAVVTVVAAVLATDEVGLPLRDPDHVAALYLALVGFGVVLLVGLDIVLRAGAPLGRVSAVASGAAARPARALDRAPGARRRQRAGRLLPDLHGLPQPEERGPAAPARRPLRPTARRSRSQPVRRPRSRRAAAPLLGTGVQTHFLSAAYVAFIVFLPLTIGIALVFSRDLRAGLFYTTAQSINWVLGAASYFLLPSLGPDLRLPGGLRRAPVSEVTRLQGILLDQRLDFLRDPASGDAAEHRGVRVAAHLDELHRRARGPAAGRGQALRIALWVWFAVTMANTIYLGWHYVARRHRRRDPRRHGPGAGRGPDGRRPAQGARAAAGDRPVRRMGRRTLGPALARARDHDGRTTGSGKPLRSTAASRAPQLAAWRLSGWRGKPSSGIGSHGAA